MCYCMPMLPIRPSTRGLHDLRKRVFLTETKQHQINKYLKKKIEEEEKWRQNIMQALLKIKKINIKQKSNKHVSEKTKQQSDHQLIQIKLHA